nr:LamG-like jellyroll fold domain-containing protein [Pelotomaculum terephthalicicum]
MEAMGGTMGWTASESKVTIGYQGTSIDLWIGQNTARVNGQEKALDVAPFVSATGRTMLPLRFVTESLGSQVQWDGATQSITITSGGITQKPVTGTPPEKGLIAHYKFDGDFRDSSGNGNDGKLNGDVGFADGVFGQCAQFKGGFLQVADNSELDLTGPYTISAWIRIAPGSDSTIISKLADNGMDSTYFANAYDYDSDISASDSTLQMWMSYDYDNSHYTEASVEVEGQDAVNKWVHAAFTNDGGKINLYVDGVPLGTAQVPEDNYVTSDSNVLIGGIIQSGASSYFQGKMDDLRIYNYALDSDQIKALGTGTAGASSIVLQVDNPLMTVDGGRE